MGSICEKCGAPIPAAVPPAAVYEQPKSSAVRAILTIVAVAFGIGILSVSALGYRASRVSKPIAANSKASDALFSIPGLGSISTGSDATADPTQLGAPIYPGAVQEKGAISLGTAVAAGAEAHFTTGDPISQVEAFYASNLPGAVVAATAAGAVINAGPSATDRVTVTISPGSGTNAGKTAIVIVRTTKT